MNAGKTREVNVLFAHCEEQLKALCESYDDEMVVQRWVPARSFRAL